MNRRSLWRKLYSAVLAVSLVTGLATFATSSAQAEEMQEYLAAEGVATVSATKDQVNLPFDPDLYYTYSLLTPAGKKVWELTLKELLAFNPSKEYKDVITLQKNDDGSGRLVFDLNKANISAKRDDVKDLYHYYVRNEPRMFLLSGNEQMSSDKEGNVSIVSFGIGKKWMADDAYQNQLMDLESNVSNLLSGIDSRQNYSQKIAAFYSKYLAKENYKRDADEANIIGSLGKFRSICSGYAEGFQYLALRAGVPTVFLAGVAGGPHGWNAVKLEDGNWYVVDSTWDDILGNRGHFLKGTEKIDKRTLWPSYAPVPTLSTDNYSFTSWLAPEEVVPLSQKAIDSVVSAVEETLNNDASKIAEMNSVTVTVPATDNATTTEQDKQLQDKLQKAVKNLKLGGNITVTLSNKNKDLKTVSDVVNKGMSVDYQLNSNVSTYQYSAGKLVDKSSGKTVDADAEVLAMAQAVSSRVLEDHQDSISDVHEMMLTIGDGISSTPSTDTEQQLAEQIKSNLLNKFDGDITVMITGGYDSVSDLIKEGLILGYEDPSGAYYTMINGQVTSH